MSYHAEIKAAFAEYIHAERKRDDVASMQNCQALVALLAGRTEPEYIKMHGDYSWAIEDAMCRFVDPPDCLLPKPHPLKGKVNLCAPGGLCDGVVIRDVCI